MKNKYIELFGLPASGKSYYSNNVLKEYINFNEKYIYSQKRLIRNFKKIILLFYMIIFHFLTFFKSVKFIKKLNISSNKKIKMILYLNSTLAIVLFANKSKKDKICLEEGLLQVLWGICYLDFENTDSIVKEFKNIYEKYLPISALHVTTNIEVIKKRLLSRTNNGGSELEHDINKDSSVIEKAVIIENKIIKSFPNIKFKTVEGE